MSFIHPGRLFLQNHRTVSTEADVLEYAEFLRTEAKLQGVIPVNLQAIFTHFEIPEPKIVPLPGQQGLLLDASIGLILINSKDIEHRQKFSKAHELVELLFSELSPGQELGAGWMLNLPGGFKENKKEFLCNWAAANLLMPPDHILLSIENHGVNFECAKTLAAECDVSLSAALVQLARNSQRPHFVVLWRMKNKPTELQNKAQRNDQLTLFSETIALPKEKLRVEWSLGAVQAPYIPKDKSVEETSLIYAAWENNIFTSGKERMSLDGRTPYWYYSENMPFNSNNSERHVISLIEQIKI
jgi:Zn-dependent peptidase ImmA (M78 family)